MPLLRCDICGCAVSQVKSVFVCDQCQPPDATIAALRARVEQLEAAQRWIPVTERLPEENRLVQVYNGSVTCGILREPQIIGGGWMIAFDYSGVLEFQFPVTHWMPLPLPPKEVE